MAQCCTHIHRLPSASTYVVPRDVNNIMPRRPCTQSKTDEEPHKMRNVRPNPNPELRWPKWYQNNQNVEKRSTDFNSGKIKVRVPLLTRPSCPPARFLTVLFDSSSLACKLHTSLPIDDAVSQPHSP